MERCRQERFGESAQRTIRSRDYDIRRNRPYQPVEKGAIDRVSLDGET